jgi:hypothetical protein
MSAVERSQVQELHLITPLANLASILEHGVLSNERAATIEHDSVADELIQERRDTVKVPGGRRLHSYANFYFNARNCMMYKRLEHHKSLGVISLSPKLLNIAGVVLADRNASTNAVLFGSVDEILPVLDYEVIHAQWWSKHEDYWDRLRHKQAMCAEALVPDVLPPSYIRGVYVSNDQAKSDCENSFDGALKFKVDQSLFFQEP